MKIFKYFIFVFLIVGVLYIYKDKLVKNIFSPRSINSPVGTIEIKNDTKDIEVIASNLNIPWEIVFLPNSDILVTERGGKLLKIGKDTKVVAEITGVKHIGEGGLLGMTLDPKFSTNKFIYLYSTTDESGSVTNRVERYKFENESLNERKVILEGIKGSSNHDGGRINFGPDGYLYITTGDAENQKLPQDKNSLNGKILRINSDGSIPKDNPFGNAVYSMGHRNPQGLAWDKDGNLWETEHGPSGVQTGNDELNKIVKGGNYGWPDVKGTQTKDGIITPILESGKSDTWAPSGLAYLNNTLFFTGLRGEALYQVKLTNDNKYELLTNFKKEFGRIRAVVVGPDGNLYLATSNTDGRGTKKEGDDKIIKILVKTEDTQ